MATIDDDRVQLLAGQARRLKSDLAHATDLLRDGKPDEASRILDHAAGYASFVTAWLEDLARPPRAIPMRGKSRGR